MRSVLFRPALLPTILSGVLFLVLIALGLWQLDRAWEKTRLLDEFGERQAGPSLEIWSVLDNPAKSIYTKIHADGAFDTEHQFLLDNRVQDGRVGYDVLTLLKLHGSNTSVLVNRGWRPQGADRNDLPDVAVGANRRVIEGVLAPVHDNAFSLGDTGYRNAGWPRVVQRVEPRTISELLTIPVPAVLLRLDADQPDGYVRNWRIINQVTPERHRAYAVQWFALAVALLICWIIFSRVSPRDPSARR